MGNHDKYLKLIISDSRFPQEFYKIVLAVIIMLLLMIPECEASPSRGDMFGNLNAKSSDMLIKDGYRHTENNQPDSALLCFTIVAHRGIDTSDSQKKKESAMAFINRWYLYFYYYLDYSSAYESLERARELAEDISEDSPETLLCVKMDFGCMYQTLSESSGDRTLGEKALASYREVFHDSQKSGNATYLYQSLLNMVTLAYDLGALESIRPEYEAFMRRPADENLAEREFISKLYEALVNVATGKYERGKALLSELLSTPFHSRYMDQRHPVYLYLRLAEIKYLEKDYKGAIADMSVLINKADSMQLKDMRLEVLRLISQYAEKGGYRDLSNEYHRQYNQLRDSLLNYSQINRVNELYFLGKIKNLDRDVYEMKAGYKIYRYATFMIVAILLIIIIFVVVIVRKNNALNRSNNNLYHKIKNLVETENVAGGYSVPATVNVGGVSDDSPEADAPGSPQIAESEMPKVKSPAIDEAEKDSIVGNLVKILETNPEIYSFDFSSERLAALLQIKYKLLLQVVNERFGKTVMALINDYRMKEACRRFSGPENELLTVEGVAHEVGFRSRSAFIAAFKKFSGMTPSVYIKIAKRESRGNQS